MRQRGYRGWAAAITICCTLTLVFLSIEKHLASSKQGKNKGVVSAVLANLMQDRGIILTADPGSLEVHPAPLATDTEIRRAPADFDVQPTSDLLKRPPEPSANVTLFAPVAPLDLELTEIDGKSSNIDMLMASLDEAFQTPIRVTSAKRSRPNEYPALEEPAGTLFVAQQPNAITPPPIKLAQKMPEPKQLLQDLAELQTLTDPRLNQSQIPIYTSNQHQAAARYANVNDWIIQVQDELHSLVYDHGLERASSRESLDSLLQLSQSADALTRELTNHQLASQVNTVAYNVGRRVAIWSALQNGLDETSIHMSSPRDSQYVRRSLLETMDRTTEYLGKLQTGEYWTQFLKLEKLREWAEDESTEWTAGQPIAVEVLKRLHWPTLELSQRRFLSQPIFEELAAHLVVWGRDPLDYRQLLQDLEALEQDSISRIRAPLAASAHVLRLSSKAEERTIASEIEKHYRNANIRISVSSELLERFMPESQYESRPVRQRILGADTKGDSTVRTDLSLRLIPSENSWNVGIGVAGEMLSQTKSSKGPAVFHNMSTASIQSQRYLRINPNGYQVSAQPTNVQSKDYLRRMSTNYDGMPVIGDFVRVLVREQFDQKRGLAQRITRRIIAKEADQELDRRLTESLQKAEEELADRIIGPLENLSLNPTVSSMRTDKQRLSIRYRVANESQLGAFTSRPRAPADSLLSIQLHESSLNNAIEQIGLSGKTWSLPELYERLKQVFNKAEWKLPDDVPQDIHIRFAERRPATVQMKDGKLSLTLRIAELSQPGKLKIERFFITSTYIPVADGLKAELVRDGVVEIQTSGSRRDRIPLRFIFAKIFVARPEIPLISPAWVADPRAEGLAVSQLDIRNGWLAAAISMADSDRAAEVAAKARELLMDLH